ncbi:hypothetical protein ABW20_dc0102385 [Dactylellina cionopaga]|nr:hypothetical protein ABW20_dc0102385 [Dactylellina cionopaga]
MPPQTRNQTATTRKPHSNIDDEQLADLKLTLTNYKINIDYCRGIESPKEEDLMAHNPFRQAIMDTVYRLGDGLRQFTAMDNDCHSLVYEICPSTWNIFFSALTNDEKHRELRYGIAKIDKLVSELEDFAEREDYLRAERKLDKGDSPSPTKRQLYEKYPFLKLKMPWKRE